MREGKVKESSMKEEKILYQMIRYVGIVEGVFYRSLTVFKVFCLRSLDMLNTVLKGGETI